MSLRATTGREAIPEWFERLRRRFAPRNDIEIWDVSMTLFYFLPANQGLLFQANPPNKKARQFHRDYNSE